MEFFKGIKKKIFGEPLPTNEYGEPLAGEGGEPLVYDRNARMALDDSEFLQEREDQLKKEAEKTEKILAEIENNAKSNPKEILEEELM
jgi:ribosomal protein L22